LKKKIGAPTLSQMMVTSITLLVCLSILSWHECLVSAAWFSKKVKDVNSQGAVAPLEGGEAEIWADDEYGSQAVVTLGSWLDKNIKENCHAHLMKYILEPDFQCNSECDKKKLTLVLANCVLWHDNQELIECYPEKDIDPDTCQLKEGCLTEIPQPVGEANPGPILGGSWFPFDFWNKRKQQQQKKKKKKIYTVNDFLPHQTIHNQATAVYVGAAGGESKNDVTNDDNESEEEQEEKALFNRPTQQSMVFAMCYNHIDSMCSRLQSDAQTKEMVGLAVHTHQVTKLTLAMLGEAQETEKKKTDGFLEV
jgi:hypothetical protein